MESLGVDVYKIPSGEVTNLPLLDLIASTGKPVLLSSGMSDWRELDAAVNVIRRQAPALRVLQCTSAYPVSATSRSDLNVMLEMRERYGVPVGLSDHTLTNYRRRSRPRPRRHRHREAFHASAALMYGSDAKHSLEPAEFADLVRGIRAIGRMLSAPVDKAPRRRAPR